MGSSGIRIGSRGSDLALWQARWVEQELRKRNDRIDVSIHIIRTKGDRILDSPLSKIGDKGLFTREIELALTAGDIDLAVHSLKDLPTQLPKGLTIGAICEREDVRDVFIPHPSNPERTLLAQREGAKIATGSLRRKCQLLSVRPDVEIIDIRGNLNTRMKKLEESDWAGMILARAGVMRLGWSDRVGEVIDTDLMLPAVGQGALGVEIRENDARIRSVVAQLNHVPTEQVTVAERALLRRLEGGCQVPIGTFARIERDGTLILDAIVGSLDGARIVRGEMDGRPENAEAIGEKLAEELLARGAAEILRQIRQTSPESSGEGAEV